MGEGGQSRTHSNLPVLRPGREILAIRRETDTPDIQIPRARRLFVEQDTGESAELSPCFLSCFDTGCFSPRSEQNGDSEYDLKAGGGSQEPNSPHLPTRLDVVYLRGTITPRRQEFPIIAELDTAHDSA